MQRGLIELSGLLSEIVEDLRFEAESNRKLVKLKETEPLVVAGDWDLLRSCFASVLRNAIWRTRTDTAVEISLLRNSGPARYCCIAIRDHGNRVAETQLKQFFKPFVTIDNGVSANIFRLDVELANAKRTVRWHNGSISACNSRNGGLVISILLPVDHDS